jgi:hypothetical protein
MIIETVHLREIAYARSGDKGTNANIGVIAYTKEGYEFLDKFLIAEIVQEYFSPLGVKETIRYNLPNLGALNFVLKGILEGGGSRSLRIDAQGKTLGQAILEMPVEIPEKVLCHCKKTC